MKKRVAILGSTGSIGTQALDVILRHPEKFEVEVDGSSLVSIDFSVGWVQWNEGINSVQEWLDRADEVMYEKKQQGQVQSSTVQNKAVNNIRTNAV